MNQADDRSILPQVSRRSLKNALLTVPLVALLLALLFLFNYFIAGERGAYHRIDFMVLWLSGKGLLEGVNLYDPPAWQLLHERVAPLYSDNPIFIFPLPTAILFIPFALLPVRFSGALWMLLSEAGIILFFTWVIRQTPYKKKLLMVALIAFIVATFQPTIIAIQSGQFNLFMLLLLAAAYVLHVRGRDLAAGVLTSLLVMRPNPVVFLLPSLLIWGLAQKKWKFLAGFAAAGAGMAIISELISPGWLFTWIDFTVGGHGKLYSYGLISPTLGGMMTDLRKLIPLAVSNVIYIILAGLLVTAGIAACIRKNLDSGYLFSLLVVLSFCVTPYAWNYDHVMLLFPLAYVILKSEANIPRIRRMVWTLVIIIYTVLPYLLRMVALQRGVDTLSALVPYAVLGLLILPQLNPYWKVQCNQAFHPPSA